MKIHGPNQMNVNPYTNQWHKQPDVKKKMSGKDRLEISEQAKQMQESETYEQKRAAYIRDIKNAVESGTYQINAEKTAEKMIAFWQKRT